MHFSVEKVDEILSVTAFHNVLVFTLSGTIRREHLQHVARIMEDALAAYPKGIAGVSLGAEGATAPAIELRNDISAIGERFAGRLLLGVTIIEDAGIFAAARRAFMRGTLLLMRRSKVVISSTIEDAARRLAAVAVQADGTPLAQAEVLALLRFCQRHLEEQSSRRS
jgi:hypothetical protein